jgi:hypothetical protein
MKLAIAAALVVAGMALVACAQRGGGIAGGASPPVIRPAAQAPGAPAQPLTAPRVIYVADFALDPNMVQTASDLPSQVMALRSGGVLARLRESAGVLRPVDSTDPQTEARQAVSQLAESIVSGLTRAGVPAQRIMQGAPVPPDSWVLRGTVDRLSEGSRTQQAVVGFGAGEPDIEISGAIDNAQEGTILTFGDESSTHRMPGGAVTRNPYVIAAKFVLSRGATGRDIEQLGGNLASEIVSYMRANGLAR